jgi:hypothetical protein
MVNQPDTANTYPQGQPLAAPMKPKRPWFKKKRFLIPAGIVLFFIVIGVITSSGNKNGAVSGNSTGTAPQNTPASSQNQVAKVGQTITVDGVNATLVSISPLAAGQYTVPKAGNAFYVVSMKLVNTSSSEQTYGVSDFHIKSGSGNITDVEVIPPSTYTANNALGDFQSLAASGNVQGDIIIQAPTGDHGAELTWKPSFFSNSTEYAWNLGL